MDPPFEQGTRKEYEENDEQEEVQKQFMQGTIM